MIQKKLEIWNMKEGILSVEEKRNIHFYSIKNFLIHFNDFQNTYEKEKVLIIFNDYFSIIEENDFILSEQESRILCYSHIMKIGQYYNHYLGFKVNMGLNGSIFVGVVLDFILLVTGSLSQIYYFPICTLIFVLMNRYKIYYYGKKNKLYGPRY